MNNKLNHWSNYWEGGNLTSLPQDFLENYDGEIGELWKDTFEKLPQQSKLLDLCTGNGAIALLAASYSASNNRDFEILGVDAAKISKDNVQTKFPHMEKLLHKVEFVGECKIEDITLQSNQFDLITSQYGIEYCDWEKTALQVNRLLKPGGRFVFISHANSTAILAYMEQEKIQYEQLKTLGFFSTFTDYFKKKLKHREVQRKLKKVCAHLIEEHKTQASDLFAGLINFLQSLITMEKSRFKQLEGEIEFYYMQHWFAYARLKDVVGVSHKIKEAPGWYKIFEKNGLKLIGNGEILQAGSENAGNYYQFIKPD